MLNLFTLGYQFKEFNFSSARSIFESSGSLKEFIIRQTSKNTFIFDVVSGNDLSNKEIEKIKDKVDTYLEPCLKIFINRVESIRRPKSGKIKYFFQRYNH